MVVLMRSCSSAKVVSLSSRTVLGCWRTRTQNYFTVLERDWIWVGETGGMLALLVERGIEVVWRENAGEGLTASCHLASGTLVCLRASFLSRRRRRRLCRAFWALSRYLIITGMD